MERAFSIKNLKIKILLFILLYAKLLASQEQKKYFIHYGHKEGLYTNEIYNTYKSTDGFMWLNSEAGLIRFDGHSFLKASELFQSSRQILDNFQSEGVLDNDKLLFLDKDTIYECDLLKYQCKRTIIPKKLMNSKIFTTKVNGVYYFLSSNKIYKFYNEAKIFREVKVEMNGRKILSLLPTQNKGIIIVTAERVYVVNERGVILDEIIHPNSPSPGFLVAHAIDDQNIILGTWEEGLLIYNLNTKKGEAIYWNNRNLTHQAVLSLYVDSNQKVWISSITGLRTYDLKTKEFELLSSDQQNKFSVFGNVFSTMMDDQGIYWFSTRKGISIYSPNYKPIKSIPINYSDIQVKTSIESMAFKPNYKDSIVMLNFYYERTIKYDVVNFRSVPFEGNEKEFFNKKTSFLDLTYYRQFLMAIRSDYKVFMVDQEKDIILQVDGNKDNDIILRFKMLDKLYCLSLGGLYEFSKDGLSMKKDYQLMDFCKKNGLRAFIQDISFQNGLYFYLTHDPASNHFIIITFDEIKKKFQKYPIKVKNDGKNFKVESMKISKNGKILLTSQAGILSGTMMGDSLQFELIDNFFGRPISSLHNLVSDDDSIFWAKQDLGLYKLNSIDKRCVDYSAYNSAVESHYHGSLYQSNNTKNIYLIGDYTLDYIEHTNKIDTTIRFIQLTDMKIDGKRVPFDKDQVEVTLKPSTKSLELHFGNFDYTNSKEQLLDYSILGSDWSAMDGNKLILNNLKSGEFVLKIRILNFDGNFVPAAFLMKVIVKPPFRQTWWFIALVSSLTGFIIWSVFKMRVNELKRLEKLRLDIARNLHDDMGSQLSQLKMLSEYNAKVKGIKDFNTISEKLAEVMQNMSEIVWSINPKYDSFAITISKLVEYGIDIYEKKGIKFHLDIEESKNNVSLNLENRRHIYLIFKEAMNNSLKYSGATEVTFSVKKSGKHTILKLHDNGIGFDPTLIKLGNGLLNMQARAEAMRCVLSISSLDGGTIVELVI